MKTPQQISSSPLPLFVYGTLMAPAVIETLIHRKVRGRSADLISSALPNSAQTTERNYEYSRHPVRGQVYPGLVNWISQPSSVERRHSFDDPSGTYIRGVLYCDLTEEDMQQLDYFEGDQYAKELCHVQLVPTTSNDALVNTSLRDGGDHSMTDATVLLPAMVYLWTNAISELDLTQDWSYDHFEREHLSTYVGTNVEPCRDEFQEREP